jgi:hypothetical protein
MLSDGPKPSRNYSPYLHKGDVMNKDFDPEDIVDAAEQELIAIAKQLGNANELLVYMHRMNFNASLLDEVNRRAWELRRADLDEKRWELHEQFRNKAEELMAAWGTYHTRRVSNATQ